MSNALEKFNPQSLAAIIGADNVAAQVNDDFAGGISSGDFLPTISIKQSRFRLRIDGDETVLKETAIDAYLVASRPNVSKMFYKDAWAGTEAASAPACSSADGLHPDENAKEPQHTTCQLCPNNAWGSKITNSGKKGKACADYKMIVLALKAMPDQPFSLRIPAASLKSFAAYAKKLSMAGVPATPQSHASALMRLPSIRHLSSTM
jgi:hypothetical protein